MVRPIGQWLGQRVAFCGVLDFYEPEPDSTKDLYRLVLRDVQVKPHCRPGAPVLVDHLWFFDFEGEAVRGNRLRQLVGLGDVIQYGRRDNSWDYAIRPVWNMGLAAALATRHDRAIAQFATRGHRATVLGQIQFAEQVLEASTKGQLLLKFESPPEDYARVHAELVEVLDSLRAELAGLEASRALAEQQRRCPVRKDPVKFVSKKRPVRGFGGV